MAGKDKSSNLEYIKKVDLNFREAIGGGGFGTVYRGSHTNWGPVAIKVLIDGYKPESTIKSLLSEPRKLQRLAHPNTIKMLGVVNEKQYYALVFEYMEHGALDNFISKYDVSMDMKLELIKDIVLGMNYLHTLAKPIIHRDLKTKNILVGRDLIAKVCDFGLSEWERYTQPMTQDMRKYSSMTNVPPEWFKDIYLTPTKSYDVYSFAIIIWEVCTQKVAFQGFEIARVDLAMSKGERPDIELVSKAGAPDVLIKIMEDCWKQNPTKRPTFSDVKESLEKIETQSSEAIEQARNELLGQINEKRIRVRLEEDGTRSARDMDQAPNEVSRQNAENGNSYDEFDGVDPVTKQQSPDQDSNTEEATLHQDITGVLYSMDSLTLDILGIQSRKPDVKKRLEEDGTRSATLVDQDRNELSRQIAEEGNSYDELDDVGQDQNYSQKLQDQRLKEAHLDQDLRGNMDEAGLRLLCITELEKACLIEHTTDLKEILLLDDLCDEFRKYDLFGKTEVEQITIYWKTPYEKVATFLPFLLSGSRLHFKVFGQVVSEKHPHLWEKMWCWMKNNDSEEEREEKEDMTRSLL